MAYRAQAVALGTIPTPSMLLNKVGMVTVTLTAYTAPMHLLTKPTSSVLRVVSPQLGMNNRSQLSFALADTAGAPNNKTSTCRVWGLRKASASDAGGAQTNANLGGTDEWKLVPLLDLGLIAGANVVPATSTILPSTGATVIDYVDTINVTADYTRAASAQGYHVVTDNEAVIDFDREGCEHLVIEGVPASGCLLHVFHVEL